MSVWPKFQIGDKKLLLFLNCPYIPRNFFLDSTKSLLWVEAACFLNFHVFMSSINRCKGKICKRHRKSLRFISQFMSDFLSESNVMASLISFPNGRIKRVKLNMSKQRT